MTARANTHAHSTYILGKNSSCSAWTSRYLLQFPHLFTIYGHGHLREGAAPKCSSAYVKKNKPPGMRQRRGQRWNRVNTEEIYKTFKKDTSSLPPSARRVSTTMFPNLSSQFTQLVLFSLIQSDTLQSRCITKAIHFHVPFSWFNPTGSPCTLEFEKAAEDERKRGKTMTGPSGRLQLKTLVSERAT